MANILIVDDDEDARMLLRLVLQRLGYESVEADGGVQGESLALQIQPDIVLLDIMMADQDGYKTCTRLRAKGYTGKIVLVSALPELTQWAKVKAMGASDYIQKPITQSTLQKHLDRVA